MNIIADLHSHTLVSHHAYSTLEEMCRYANKIGLKAIAMTNHTSQMPDGANDWHFNNMWSIPRQIDNVTVIRGAEVNIIDFKGNIDLDEELLVNLDLVIASLHNYTIAPGTKQEHTLAYENVIKNKYVDIIGHPTSFDFDFDYDHITKLASKMDKVIELNSHSLKLNPKTIENYKKLINSCIKNNTYMVISSDAHISFELADVSEVLDIVEELNVPKELIINISTDNLNNYFKLRNKNIPVIK